MKIVSPLLKHVLYPSLAKTGVFRRTAGRGVAVLTYHGVVPHGYKILDPVLDGNLIDRQMLRRQLRLLKARYHVISPQDFLSWCRTGCELPPLSVLITCDDGLRNNLTDMLPILQEEKVRCLFFVTGYSASDEPSMLWHEELFLILLRARFGQFEISGGGVSISGELGVAAQRRAIWRKAVKRLSQIDPQGRQAFLSAARVNLGVSDGIKCGSNDSPRDRRFRLLRRTDLMQLESAGMTVGAHTLSHPMLSQCSPELARNEIAESRLRLEAAIDKPVWAFAYPFGNAESVNPQIIAMAREAGFEAAFLNISGGLGADTPRFAIPRVHVTSAMKLGEFEAHVAGFYGSLQRWTGRGERASVLTAARARQ